MVCIWEIVGELQQSVLPRCVGIWPFRSVARNRWWLGLPGYWAVLCQSLERVGSETIPGHWLELTAQALWLYWDGVHIRHVHYRFWAGSFMYCIALRTFGMNASLATVYSRTHDYACFFGGDGSRPCRHFQISMDLLHSAVPELSFSAFWRVCGIKNASPNIVA